MYDRRGSANPNSTWAWWADRLESQGRAAVPDQRLSAGGFPSCSEEVFVLLRVSTVFLRQPTLLRVVLFTQSPPI